MITFSNDVKSSESKQRHEIQTAAASLPVLTTVVITVVIIVI